MMLQYVMQFHRKFSLPMPPGPTPLPRDLFEFRVAFMIEEINELKEAYEKGDLPKQLDALVDLVYVALGTALMMGFWHFTEAFRRVHEANMRKVKGDGKSGRHPTMDVIKPAGWSAPQLDDLARPFAS